MSLAFDQLLCLDGWDTVVGLDHGANQPISDGEEKGFEKTATSKSHETGPLWKREALLELEVAKQSLLAKVELA